MTALTSFQTKEPVFQIAFTVSLFAGVLELVTVTFFQETVRLVSLNTGGYEIVSLAPVKTLGGAELDKLVLVALDEVNLNFKEVLADFLHRFRIHGIPFVHRSAQGIELSVLFFNVRDNFVVAVVICLFARDNGQCSAEDSHECSFFHNY